jgi:hypothetical protein
MARSKTSNPDSLCRKLRSIKTGSGAKLSNLDACQLIPLLSLSAGNNLKPFMGKDFT